MPLTSVVAESMKWLLQRQFVQPCALDKASHLLTDGCGGGFVSVPPEEEKEFHALYSRDVANGHALFFSERRTPHFALCVDIDGITFRDAEERQQLLKILDDTVASFWVENEKQKKLFMMLVMTREGGDNLHVVYPYLIVDDEKALVIREGVISRLSALMPKAQLDKGKTWEDVVDRRIYEANGFRMPGSHKSVVCPECKGKKCISCLQIGKIDIGRIYKLSQVLQRDETVPETKVKLLQENFLRFLRLASIRRHGAPLTEGWRKYDGCPLPIETPEPDLAHLEKLSVTTRFNKTAEALQKRPKLSRPISKEEKQASNRAGNTYTKKLPRAEYPDVWDACLTEIHRFHKPTYQLTQIRQISSDEKFSQYRVDTIGDGSMVCLNLINPPREHQNVHTWFYFAKSGAEQRCWCTCPKTSNRHYGSCSNYSSHPNQLLATSLQVLFRTPRAPTPKPPETPVRTSSAASPVSTDPEALRLKQLCEQYTTRLHALLHPPKTGKRRLKRGRP